MTEVIWKNEPDDHDYPAAANYLALLAPPALIDLVVEALRTAPVSHQLAKDILRAASLPALDRDNAHVHGDLDKIAKGRALSPVLLVRGDIVSGVALQIADGYHRVCASYLTDENTSIPCRLATTERDRALGRHGRTSAGPSVG